MEKSPNDPRIFETIKQEINWFIVSQQSAVVCICSDKDKPAACRHRLFKRYLKKAVGYFGYDVQIKIETDYIDYVFVFSKIGLKNHEEFLDKNLTPVLRAVASRSLPKHVNVSQI